MPTQSERGILSAQFHPGICHSNGTASDCITIIMTITAKQMMNDSLKRCQMRGTSKRQRQYPMDARHGRRHVPSIQNVDRSTSLTVDPHVLEGRQHE